MKDVYLVSTEQHVDMKSGVSWSKKSNHFTSLLC